MTTLTIQIPETLSIRSDFKIFTDVQVTKDTTRIILDFAKCRYIDSTALGELIVLRDKHQNIYRHITILHPKQEVMSIFRIANFHSLFTIIT